jgi:exo-beta-1,3-glucanase (GH17 family)
VARATAISHKPVYITEVGFPTAGPTADSLRYTEAEQASAIYRFGRWAEHTKYVAAVTFFTYRDEREGGGYGVETRRGVKKKAFKALERLQRRGKGREG